MKKKQLLLCPYDGFKLRIYSKSYLDFMLLNAAKYNLVGTIAIACLDEDKKLDEAKELDQDKKFDQDQELNQDKEKVMYPITGEYKGFSIKIAPTRLGLAVEIAGSFHKYFYVKENYQPFYWKDFIDVYNQFINFFALDPDVVSVVNLEVGINVPTLAYWLATARKICHNILFFNPPSPCCGKDIKQYKKFGFGWCTLHDEYWIKIYDKLPKFSEKVDDIIRLEKKHKKSKPLKKLGVHTLADLLKEEVHVTLIDNLLKSLNKLIIYQGELERCDGLTEADKDFLLKYKKDEAWDIAYSEDKKRLFKEVKKTYNQLIQKYCFFDLKVLLLNEAKRLLYQTE